MLSMYVNVLYYYITIYNLKSIFLKKCASIHGPNVENSTHHSFIRSMVCQLQMWCDSLQRWKLHRKTGLPESKPLKNRLKHGSNMVEHLFSDPLLSFKHQHAKLFQIDSLRWFKETFRGNHGLSYKMYGFHEIFRFLDWSTETEWSIVLPRTSLLIGPTAEAQWKV